MEAYYNQLLQHLDGYTVQGLFDGNREIKDIVTLQQGTKGHVFFFDQEPMIASMDQELWRYVFSKPTIFANSELNSVDKTHLRENYPNFVDWYYFSHGLLASEWFGSQYMTNANDWPYEFETWHTPKMFTFDCNLITGPRQYRLKIFHELHKKGLVDYSFYSFNASHDWHSDLKKYDHFNLLREPLAFPLSDVSHDQFGKATHSRSTVADVPLATVIPLETYHKAHVVLVLETLFTENKKHLTEKTFKPIAAAKPFVLAGGYQNLQYLKQYGFETFDSVWNESYDNIKDPTDRLHAIVDLLDYLCHLSYAQQKDIMFAAHEIAVKNWYKFWTGYTEFMCKTEALNNLTIAKAELESMQI